MLLRHPTFQLTDARDQAFSPKLLTLTPSAFLLSKLLAAVEGEKEAVFQRTEPQARGYTNMQQAHQSGLLMFKLQVQISTARTINAMQQVASIETALLQTHSHTV